jgi:hypothetical protein
LLLVAVVVEVVIQLLVLAEVEAVELVVLDVYKLMFVEQQHIQLQ